MLPLFRSFTGHLAPDLQLLARAVDLLGASEYQVFAAAQRRWFGPEAGKVELERAFAGFLHRQAVPIWVRHYCREALRRADQDTLDPRDFGIARPRPGVTRLLPGQGYASAITFAAFMIYLFILI